jgi:Carboxypeptidase regulatory-like domain/TonB dependent receptor
MKRLTLCVLALVSFMAVAANAQDYRGRVQGAIADETHAVLPGVNVTLRNEATNVTSSFVSDELGRYIFDFVDPGRYTVSAELPGFNKSEQRSVRVQQRGTVTVDFVMMVGGVEQTISVTDVASVVDFKSTSSNLKLEHELLDQVPISGRNPYNLSAIDPTITVSPATNENRPYHHAYANDYDAGGGTRRANDVLLDGVPLGASYKTAYTPAVDAVEEITISKTSVDAENGHSLGGIISLNMKSGTNELHGSVYTYGRTPSLNAVSDPTLRRVPGQLNVRGADLRMYGGTVGLPIVKNKAFSFTSFEVWDDKRPLTIIRTVPTELERRGDFSQSAVNGKVRTIYNPFSSALDSGGKIVRTPFDGNGIPSNMLDPTAVRMLADIPMPNLPGNVDNWQGSVYDKADYWNLSQRVDVNLSPTWKVFARYGQFKANLYQQNPTQAGFFPLSGSNRYGLDIAGDSVWVLSNKTSLNVRGSFYNMTDEFYNPSLLLGKEGLEKYWPGNPWYVSLYNSGYVYYPALDVTSNTSQSTLNRLGRQGREWFQHPDAWTISARMNHYRTRHDMKWGGEMRAYYGEAARFEPINLAFFPHMTANSSDSPDLVNSGNQWASFMLGALDSQPSSTNQSSARLVPLQTPNLKGYAAYFQDDIDINSRITLNLGLRWEFEAGPTDSQNRLSQRIDLTQPIPEMQSTPPNMPAQAVQLMSSKGYSYIFNGAWVFASKDNPHAWHGTTWNFLPRAGVSFRTDKDSVIRVGYARFLNPTTNVRDTLGDFVEQYSGYAQTTLSLGPANGVPRQLLSNPFPTNVNPVIEPYGQTLGRYTNLGGQALLDQYELRPQINDRFNLSYQREIARGIGVEANYFFNYGTRVPYDKNLNMMDPAFRYEQKALINTSVPNPFRNYLTPDKFPGSLRNQSNVNLSSLLVPYPQYSSISQRNTNGRKLKSHMLELRMQQRFRKGLSFVAAYAYSNEKRQEWFDDIAQYKTVTSNGEQGWEWRPAAESNALGANPRHRMTTVLTWQLPIGRGHAFFTNMPKALDLAVGGWQLAPSTRYYSGRLVLFDRPYIVDGNPKLDNPTRDRWFDTTKFKNVQDSFTPRTNAWYYDGLTGPSVFLTDLTLTKFFNLGESRRIEARAEAYNLFNSITWALPGLDITDNANFGKVARKRVDGTGREIQLGLRFVF